MAFRGQSRDDAKSLLEDLHRRVMQLEDATANRVLPKGYIWRVVGGQLEVVNQANGNSAVIL